MKPSLFYSQVQVLNNKLQRVLSDLAARGELCNSGKSLDSSLRASFSHLKEMLTEVARVPANRIATGIKRVLCKMLQPRTQQVGSFLHAGCCASYF